MLLVSSVAWNELLQEFPGYHTILAEKFQVKTQFDQFQAVCA